MAGRDIGQAREAFKEGDPSLSKSAHGAMKSQEQHKTEAGEYIKAVVFGGLDGIITTFAIVAAAAASGLSRALILIVGFANLMGDAVGMGVGDYLSSRAEDDHTDAERIREAWEMEHFPEFEKKEMRDIYEGKGLSADSAREIVDLLWQDKNTFLDIMMIEELGLKPVDKSVSPLKSSLVTFTSFMIFGGLPMLAYIFAGHYDTPGRMDYVFWIAVALFGVALFLLGAYKGFIANRRWYLSGFFVVVQGAITTVAAYFIGYALEGLADKIAPPPQ